MKRAFLIGANGPNESKPLRYARKDVEDMARALQHQRCDFDVVVSEPEWSASTVREQLFSMAESCNEDDTFLCYFSGHGSIADTQGDLALLLDQTDTAKLLTTTLFVTDLVKAANFCKAKNRLIILDCCHAGQLASTLGLKSGIELPMSELGVPRESILVLMASGKLERTRELEDLQGGFLTQTICAALTTEFARADIDGDEILSIEDLMGYLNKKALEHNRNYPKASVPYPEIFGKQKGKMYLTQTPLSDWRPVEIDWPHDISMVVLPLSPFINQNDDSYAVCLSKHPITNAQYRSYMDATGAPEPVGKNLGSTPSGSKRKWRGPFVPMQDPNFNSPEQPVVCVSYTDACRYCYWLNTHYSSEARAYGIARPSSAELWQFGAYGKQYLLHRSDEWLRHTATVHHKSSYPTSIDVTGARTNTRGLADMIGNVWEWCAPTYFYETGGGNSVASVVMETREGFPAILGGGFLDDLERVTPLLDSFMLPEQKETKHSDIGFRLACRIKTTYLPKETRFLLDSGVLPSVPFYNGAGFSRATASYGF